MLTYKKHARPNNQTKDFNSEKKFYIARVYSC